MNTITQQTVAQYAGHLYSKRRAASTVQKYVHYIHLFSDWLGARPFTREAFAAWADQLDGSPRTVNGAISAVNGLAAFLQCPDVHLEFN